MILINFGENINYHPILLLRLWSEVNKYKMKYENVYIRNISIRKTHMSTYIWKLTISGLNIHYLFL